jgi:hypothetical protein
MREDVNAWPLAEAGLPARVVNRCAEAGLRTLGELRALSADALGRVRGLEAKSLARTREFLALCDEVEAGRSPLPTLDLVLQRFLKPAERDVLTARYGLAAPPDGVPPGRVTLQRLGSGLRLTRERVRQIERSAVRRLSTRLAQACLAPVIEPLLSLLDSRGGIAGETEANTVRSPAAGERRPSAVLHLLADCGGSIRLHNGLFTTLQPAVLQEAERRALGALADSGTPCSPDRMAAAVAGALPAGEVERARRIADCAVERLPGVSRTADGAFFLTSGGASLVLRDVLRHMGGQGRAGEIRAEYNRRMRPGSRRGVGFVLKALRTDPGFRALEGGVYGLADGRVSGVTTDTRHAGIGSSG